MTGPRTPQPSGQALANDQQHPGYAMLPLRAPQDHVAGAFLHPLDYTLPVRRSGSHGHPPAPAGAAPPPRPSGWAAGSKLNSPLGPRGERIGAHRPGQAGLSPDGRQMQIGRKGQVRLLRTMQHGHGEDRKSDPVKYLHTTAARQPYLVEIGSIMRRRGVIFDTRVIKQHYVDKMDRDPRLQIGLAAPGNSRVTGKPLPVPVQDWGNDSLIWVCAVHPVTDRPIFYSHVCRGGGFHHSSFTGGSDLIAGGEWVVRNGRLLRVSPNSGHYRPPMDYFYRAVLHMSSAFRPETTVYLYDIVTDRFIDYPIRQFVASPTMGGRLRVHPQG